MKAISEMATTPPITPAAIAIVCCVVMALPVTAASLLDIPAPFVCDSNGELVDGLAPVGINAASPANVVDVFESPNGLEGDGVVAGAVSV